ncbi:hypothetical protein DV737_g2070, partial [Chaetothyriales sp. CBS 132003]
MVHNEPPPMADWAGQYLAALKARDGAEKANIGLYDHCARVEDEKAELAQQLAGAEAAAAADREEAKAAAAAPAPSLFRVSSPPAPRAESPSVAEMRQDLARAQQERSELQRRVDLLAGDLEALKARSRKEGKKLAQSSAQVAHLTTRLRDRDEELRGKAKLVEDVQDENVTLNLQLNVAEERAQKLKEENQELIDRWMARMGKEAERMNAESRFG